MEGHTIEALPVLESLKKKGYHLTVLCDTKLSYGYKSKYPNIKLMKVNYPYDSKEFIAYFIDLIKKFKFEIVIPLYDPSAEFLSKNKELLKEHLKFIIPDHDIFASGFEKNKLMEICRINGFPHPKTSDIKLNSIGQTINYVGFPALIKPNITSGGRGMSVVNTKEELIRKYVSTYKEFGDCTLQEYIPFGGKQFKVQLFRDKMGKILGSTVIEKIRFYPEKGGSSSCNVTIEAPEHVSLTSKILDILNWEGFADFDLIEDPRDKIIKVMEINPRFPACIKSSFNSGVDFAEMYVDYCYNREIKNYEYLPGSYLRYFGLEVLWFIKSENRFKSNPSWFKFFGKNIYYQDGSIRDPLPFVIGTLGNLKKLLNPKFRKSKSGLRN
jgi:predicted ATP-grasp superfamily ATP-dependent carboligase